MARLEFRVVRAPESSAQHKIAAPPCFFSRVCLRHATIEKAGRSVCGQCAARLRGVEYPLRDASLQPLYLTGRTVCEDLDMIED